MYPPEADRRRAHIVAEMLIALVGILLLVWALTVNRHWFEIHTMPYFCAERPAELVRADVERWVGAAVGVLLLFVVRPRAGTWIRRRSGRAIAGAALRVFLATALALLVSEGLLRFKKPPAVPGGSFQPDWEPDDRYSWRYKRAHTTEMRVGDKLLRYVLDANGYRVRSESDVIDHARPTILSTGESVAFGFGVNYEETYAAMLGEDLSVQVVNLAVQNYANDGAYMRLADELPRFSHPIATVTLVMNLMVPRNTLPGRTHLVIEDDGTERFVPAEGRSSTISPLLDLLPKLYHSDEALRRARAILVATAKRSTERGAFPLFVLTNLGYMCLPDETGAPSIERTLFDELDLAYVRVDLRDERDPVIGHPSSRGHRKIADAIERVLREHGIGATSANQGAFEGKRQGAY